MKIAVIATPLDAQSAGIHYHTAGLVRSLAARPEVSSLSVLRMPEFEQHYGGEDIVVKGLFRGKTYDPWRLFVSVPSILKKINPDVVIEPAHTGPFGLPDRIKRITFIHDMTPWLFPEFHRGISVFGQKLIVPGALRKSHLVVANSENTRNDIVKRFPHLTEKTKVVYPGVDPLFRPDVSGNSKQYSNGTPYFLSVGTLEPRKNLSLLLDAWEIFLKETGNVPVKLIITGQSGWKNSDLTQRVKSFPFSDRIVFTGYVPRETMPSLYHDALGFVFPSLYEGFGFPLAEAMSCGTPCLSSDAGSLKETGGDAVLYFHPSDSVTLSKSMMNLYSDEVLRKRLSEAGLKQAALFSWEKFGKELVDLCR